MDGGLLGERRRLEREARGRLAQQHGDGVLELRALQANVGEL